MSLISKLKGDKVVWFVVLALSFFSFLPIFSASSNFGINFIFSNFHNFNNSFFNLCFFSNFFTIYLYCDLT